MPSNQQRMTDTPYLQTYPNHCEMLAVIPRATFFFIIIHRASVSKFACCYCQLILILPCPGRVLCHYNQRISILPCPDRVLRRHSQLISILPCSDWILRRYSQLVKRNIGKRMLPLKMLRSNFGRRHYCLTTRGLSYSASKGNTRRIARMTYWLPSRTVVWAAAVDRTVLMDAQTSGCSDASRYALLRARLLIPNDSYVYLSHVVAAPLRRMLR